ncbi:MAG: alpha/beta hydrolase [Candidatus Eremiobacteraeota bacterium]|nr:alpha/beta hydrolase [Candidatus Eremiobacteraeota bacterium]
MAVRADAQAPIVVPADAVVVKPSPSASITRWVAAAGRARFSLDIGGGTLRGYRYAAPGSRLTVLFFNGNGLVVDTLDDAYRALASLGADVVVADYRGYGFSTGTAAVAAWNADGVALYDALAKSGPVVVQGFSLGTCVAAHVASLRPVAGTVLDAPYATAAEELAVVARLNGMAPDVASRLVPGDDARAAFDETTLVAHSTSPLLVIHGSADAEVPIAQGQEVVAASAAARKQFVEVPGAGHREIVTTAKALEVERAFLHGLLPPEAGLR